jgi:Ran-interacting Mog1 protein
MSDLISKELYGGAMTAELPKDFIDASDLRQVPDHQEVFLSPRNLTSLIFETNQYVNKENDAQANIFHFRDVIFEDDDLAEELPSPTKITMSKDSLKAFPAYVLQGGIISPEIDKKASSALPVEWQQTPQMNKWLTRVYQLVVRMKEYETDLCIRINIPTKEMTSQDEVEKEETFAKAMMQKIAETLDVINFGLFGTE